MCCRHGLSGALRLCSAATAPPMRARPYQREATMQSMPPFVTVSAVQAVLPSHRFVTGRTMRIFVLHAPSRSATNLRLERQWSLRDPGPSPLIEGLGCGSDARRPWPLCRITRRSAPPRRWGRTRSLRCTAAPRSMLLSKLSKLSKSLVVVVVEVV